MISLNKFENEKWPKAGYFPLMHEFSKFHTLGKVVLEFLNVHESFTLVLTKITRHRTPLTERDEGMQL